MCRNLHIWRCKIKILPLIPYCIMLRSLSATFHDSRITNYDSRHLPFSDTKSPFLYQPFFLILKRPRPRIFPRLSQNQLSPNARVRFRAYTLHLAALVTCSSSLPGLCSFTTGRLTTPYPGRPLRISPALLSRKPLPGYPSFINHQFPPSPLDLRIPPALLSTASGGTYHVMVYDFFNFTGSVHSTCRKSPPWARNRDEP